MTIDRHSREQVAVVTGGGSGIGLAVVKAFLDQKSTAVLAMDKEMGQLSQIAESSQLRLFVADLTEASAADEAVRCARMAFERVDVLVNVVGLSAGGTAETVSDADWIRLLDINLGV